MSQIRLIFVDTFWFKAFQAQLIMHLEFFNEYDLRLKKHFIYAVLKTCSVLTKLQNFARNMEIKSLKFFAKCLLHLLIYSSSFIGLECSIFVFGINNTKDNSISKHFIHFCFKMRWKKFKPRSTFFKYFYKRVESHQRDHYTIQ